MDEINAPQEPTGGLRIRQAVRALIMDPENRILLVRFEFPTATRWATPGGGIDEGEGVFDALRRELLEEVGLKDFKIGPLLWDRLHITPFSDGNWDGQKEVVYLVRTPRFEPNPALSPEELRNEYVHEIRWWTPKDVFEDMNSTFAPRALAAILKSVIENGPPKEPWTLGL
jgi:8-oxo-dGTP pyrophosphatase MutT (NUDIX family)